MNRGILTVVIAASLTGCFAEAPSAGTPVGEISGIVNIGVDDYADCGIAISDPQGNSQIDSVTINDDGTFNTDALLNSGVYIATVECANSVSYDAAFSYEQGSDASLLITPLTSIATSLFNFKRQLLGDEYGLDKILSASYISVSDTFNFNVTDVVPEEPNPAVIATNGLNDGNIYAMYIHAISNLGKYSDVQGTPADISSALIKDIQSDGRLDGLAVVDGGGDSSVSINSTPLPDEFWRKGLMQSFMRSIDPDAYSSSVTSNLLALAEAYITKTSAIYRGTYVGYFDEVAPEIKGTVLEIGDSVSIMHVQAFDDVGIETAIFTTGGNVIDCTRQDEDYLCEIGNDLIVSGMEVDMTFIDYYGKSATGEAYLVLN